MIHLSGCQGFARVYIYLVSLINSIPHRSLCIFWRLHSLREHTPAKFQEYMIFHSHLRMTIYIWSLEYNYDSPPRCHLYMLVKVTNNVFITILSVCKTCINLAWHSRNLAPHPFQLASALRLIEIDWRTKTSNSKLNQLYVMQNLFWVYLLLQL